MKRNILIKLMTLIVVIAFGFSLSACSGLSIVSAAYEGDRNDMPKLLGNLIMNADETLTISQSTFDGVDSNVKSGWSVGKFDRFELFVVNESHESVVTIKNNIITASNSGYTRVCADVYIKGKDPSSKRVLLKWTVIVAEIHVINEDTMTHITTAQELADMNNDLSGHYILKSDIDLSDWDDWEPIGNFTDENRFKGIFVNKGGYKITNLKISSSKSIFNTIDECIGGLFGCVAQYSHIDGIILENVYIDFTDFDNFSKTYAGGIVGYNSGIITNSRVQGEIAATTVAGGIASVNLGSIIDCSFIGTVLLNSQKDLSSIVAGGTTGIYTAGGIAGYNFGVISNCCVTNSLIKSSFIAGGIVGVTEVIRPIFNCTDWQNWFDAPIWGFQIGHSNDQRK